MSVQYEQKQATVRYEFGKVRLEEILKRYVATRFTVSPAGPVTAFVRQEKATVKAWASGTDPSQETTIFVELIPAEAARFGKECGVSVPNRPPGLKLAKDVEEIQPDAKSGSRRFRFRLASEAGLKGGEIPVPVQFRYGIVEKDKGDRPFSGEIVAPLLVEDGRPLTAPSAGVALVGGFLDLGLGHLCDQKGCVDHFHRSLQPLAGVVGVRPRPGLKDSGASVYVRAGQPIDVWNLRQKLRDQGVEVRRLIPREIGPFSLQVELRRWGVDACQCLVCLEQAVKAVRSVDWAARSAAAESGLKIRVREGEPDLAALLDALEQKALAPSAVWLVPEGVAVPPPAAPAILRPPSEPKRGGSEAHPLIRFDFDHECQGAMPLLAALGQLPWASRTRQAPDAPQVVAAVGDRQHADLSSVLRELRSAGRQPGAIRVSGFGQIRIQCDFAHLCGEVEYSKPPDPKKAAEGEKPPAEGEPKKEQKPFVPQPLRPASSSNARKAIEKALAGVSWIQEATYKEYHTKPEFNGPRRLWLSLVPAREETVRPDELIRALRDAGFPPLAVRVSRTFPGLAFGERLPDDLELVTATGETRLLSSLRKEGRPLAVGFVSLNCPKWDKYKYAADPKFYQKLKQTLETCKERVDFVAVSANPDDPFPQVAEFWERAGMNVPLLHDARGLARSVLNAQVTPPPHWFVFDGEGRLRYAGDAHDQWDKPEAAQKEHLRGALDLVLAGKTAGNGAVFFGSSKCNCSSPGCKCPKCGCGPSCRCAIKH